MCSGGNKVDPLQNLTYQQMNLINTFRRITHDMALWSGILINCISRNDGCTESVYQRLYKTVGDMYETLSMFYGPKTAENFVKLITRHAILLKDLTEAIQANDQHRADEIYQEWHQNAHDMAAFLSGINPYWSESQWNELLDSYLRMMYQQIIMVLTKDYAKGVDIFDRSLYHSMLIADYFSEGIMKSLQNDGSKLPPQLPSQPPFQQPSQPPPSDDFCK